jgi:hypothetical protein
VTETPAPPRPREIGPPPDDVLRASEGISDDELRAQVRKSASRYLRAREERIKGVMP